MNSLVDSHCHLDLLDNLDQVIEQARDKNVNKIILPAINYQSCLKILNIAKNYDNIFLALGIHPEEFNHNPNLDINGEMKKIDSLINQSHKVVAVGECGLDFKFNKNYSENEKNITKQKQIQLFKAHLDLAQKYQLPIIIHNRHATNELIDLVKNQNLKGVFHCFVGSKKTVRKIVNLKNLYFGLGGIITLDLGLSNVAADIPLEKIILETDSPYLTPMPVKLDKPWPNQPANLYYIAQKLSEIKNISFEKTSQITTNNCKSLFKI